MLLRAEFCSPSFSTSSSNFGASPRLRVRGEGRNDAEVVDGVVLSPMKKVPLGWTTLKDLRHSYVEQTLRSKQVHLG